MAKRFSDRIGVTKPNTVPQVEGMTEELRASLWNVLDGWLDADEPREGTFEIAIIKRVALRFQRVPVDTVPLQYRWTARAWLREIFFALEWHGAYNLWEFLLEELKAEPRLYSPVGHDRLARLLNECLEREFSGYRVMQLQFVPLTSEADKEAVETVLKTTLAEELQGARTHLEEALRLLSRKPRPDNRNAIKEAISAVESTAKVLSGVTSGGLKDALAALRKRGLSLHGSLQAGLLNIYGYTSDKDGIRHALLEGTEPDAAEALFMVVACSAFVSLLIAKTSRLASQ